MARTGNTVALAGALALMVTGGAAWASAGGPHKAVATLKTSTGEDAGTATATVTKAGLHLAIAVRGLPAGQHGAHVHTIGKCIAPDFASAGGHWNPTWHQHGTMNPMGAHQGDLPNLTVAADGRGKLSIDLPGATLAGLLDADGSAIVIHAAADDMKTDPSGNSGGRIACGVFAAK
jgi:Cu-Zn family superoxide dismutase